MNNNINYWLARKTDRGTSIHHQLFSISLNIQGLAHPWRLSSFYYLKKEIIKINYQYSKKRFLIPVMSIILLHNLLTINRSSDNPNSEPFINFKIILIINKIIIE